MIEIIPAIDIIDGCCVRLTKGEYRTRKIYDASVGDMVRLFASSGIKRIHLVDLDGAKASVPCNLASLEEAASILTKEFSSSVNLEWGGGIADSSDLQSVFDAGADYAIVGSVAVSKPELFETWLMSYPGRMILGADVRDGKVAVKGWLEDSLFRVEDLVARFSEFGLTRTICTDISRDGMLQGPSFDLYVGLQSKFPNVCFTVSGGISSMSDIEKLDSLGLAEVIVGKAIYEGLITVNQIRRWSLNE